MTPLELEYATEKIIAANRRADDAEKMAAFLAIVLVTCAIGCLSLILIAVKATS